MIVYGKGADQLLFTSRSLAELYFKVKLTKLLLLVVSPLRAREAAAMLRAAILQARRGGRLLASGDHMVSSVADVSQKTKVEADHFTYFGASIVDNSTNLGTQISSFFIFF